MRHGTIVAAAYVCASVAAACGSSPSASMSTAPTGATSPTTFIELIGQAMNTAFEPITGVTAEVVDGVAAGLSTNSGTSTMFSLKVPAARDVTIRLSKDGYAPNTVTLRAPANPFNRIPFYLEPAGEGGGIPGGPVTLTVSTEGCRMIPPELRTQIFSAELRPTPNAPAGSMLTVAVDKGDAPFLNSSAFIIGRAGDHLASFPYSDPLMVWQATGSQYFGADPDVVGTPPPGAVGFSFPARIQYGDLKSPPPLYLAWYDTSDSNFNARESCSGHITLTPR